MSTCKSIRTPKRQLCVGDMRHKIKIFTRSIKAPTSNSVDFGEDFTQINEVWSALKTKDGIEIFDGTNVIGVATHLFYIRHISGVTAESWIEYQSEYYDILKTQNYDQDSRFVELACNIRGDKTRAVNQT